VVLDRLVRTDVAEAHLRPDRHLARLDLLLRDDARVRSRSSSIAMRASRWPCSVFAVSYSAFSAMSPNSLATRIRSATSRRRSFERY
jgi:hypothetical protein